MEEMNCVDCGRGIPAEDAKCKSCNSTMDCDDGECNCACGQSQSMSDMWCKKCLAKHADEA